MPLPPHLRAVFGVNPEPIPKEELERMARQQLWSPQSNQAWNARIPENPRTGENPKTGNMPPQLRKGLERRRWMLARFKHEGGGRAAAEHGPKQRPIIEDMDKGRMNIRAFNIPWNGQIIDRNISLRFPFLATVIATPYNVEMKHRSGYRQAFGIKEARTGGWLRHQKMGRRRHPRRYWVCNCGKPVADLYEHNGRIGCRHCIKSQYACQSVNQEGRKALAGIKKRKFLQRHKLRRDTKWRIEASIKPASKALLGRSKRISAKCLEPRTSYSVHLGIRELHLP